MRRKVSVGGSAPERGSSWPLPVGWCWAELGSLGHWTGGGTPSKANSSFWTNGSVPWVSPKDMKVDVITDTEDMITEKAVENSSAKYVPPQSVLMVMRSGILRHSFPVAVNERTVTLNQDLRALTPIHAVDPRYLSRFFKCAANQILSECSKDGTTVNSIEAGPLERVLVPVAPLAEQRRIVARIDELFAQIEEGEAALEEALKRLETFRRALLKAAVTGELTKDWRAANSVKETGHDLLARIKAEREAAQAVRKRRGRHSEPATLDASELPALPDGWAWATLDALANSVRNGTSAAPKAPPNSHEILRISAVRPLKVDTSQIRYLSEEQARAAAESIVDQGDLLFTRYNGSAELVGVGAVYRGPSRFYPDKIIRVRFCSVASQLLNFVELAVNCGEGRKHIASNIKTTAGQQGLSGESLKSTPVPIPPLAEAIEILRRVSEALNAHADTLAMLDAEAADAARLRQSILKAAFEGRLVPQDSDDEPASVMLERYNSSVPNQPRQRRGTGKS